MILNGGDISKITPEVVKKVEQAEQQEGYVATVTLQTINNNIFLCNVVFAKPGTDTVAFTSLNLHQRDSDEVVFNMQDGKGDGFEITKLVIDFDDAYPQSAEDFAGEVLSELFVHGWD